MRMSDPEKPRLMMSVSPPVMDRIREIRDERAAALGRQVTMTEILELLLAFYDRPVARS